MGISDDPSLMDLMHMDTMPQNKNAVGLKPVDR